MAKQIYVDVVQTEEHERLRHAATQHAATRNIQLRDVDERRNEEEGVPVDEKCSC